MRRARSKLLRSGGSQTVRLPKAVEFPQTVRDVDITVIGCSRVISPVGQSWDHFFDGSRVSDDFMRRRIEQQSLLPLAGTGRGLWLTRRGRKLDW
jgi:antitoxin VapB